MLVVPYQNNRLLLTKYIKHFKIYIDLVAAKYQGT